MKTPGTLERTDGEAAALRQYEQSCGNRHARFIILAAATHALVRPDALVPATPAAVSPE